MIKTLRAAILMAATIWNMSAQDVPSNQGAEPDSRLTLVVLNQAGVPGQRLGEMFEDLTGILRQARIAADFIVCPHLPDVPRPPLCSQPLSADRILLQLLPGQPARRLHSVGTSTVDVATGTASIVLFTELAASLAKDSGWSWPELLAHLAGHEIGHVLLASREHSRNGIMRAVWSTTELGALRHAQAMFDSTQSKKMLNNLTARVTLAQASVRPR